MGLLQLLAVAETALGKRSFQRFQFPVDGLALGIVIVQLRLFSQKEVLQFFDGLAKRFCPFDIFIITKQENIRFQDLEALVELLIFFRDLGLPLQRVEPGLDFVEDVLNTGEVFACPLELSFSFFLADAVGHDAGGFFKNLAAVFAFLGKDFVDPALADQGIAFPADARIAEKLLNVSEPAAGFVQLIFAVPAAINAARYAYLGKSAFQRSVAVVKRQGDFAVGGALSLLRAAENHVFHLRAAQDAGALLAQHPTDGVADIALARAVRPDDAGNSLIEDDLGPIHKGFEPVQFEFFKLHP